ncbi:MAG: hypothetical protein ACO3KD_05955 [Gaiellales bacterium]
MSAAETERLVGEILEELGEDLEVQRVTVRLRSDDAVFPVAHEWLGAGAASIRDTPTLDMSTQPVVLAMQAGAEQVPQDDCRAATDDPGFQAMLELFGGMKAQIVTAVRDRSGEIVLLLSVHDLVAPRTWSDIEKRWCRHGADRIWELVAG